MGIYKSIFGSKYKSTSATMTFQQAADIAGSYGDVLVNNTMRTIADTSKLPYPKNIIKQALIVLLNQNTDSQMLEYLKSSYWLLANWQDGVGPTNVGLELSNMDLTTDPVELAKQVSDQSSDVQGWSEKVYAERLQLQAELKELGY